MSETICPSCSQPFTAPPAQVVASPSVSARVQALCPDCHNQLMLAGSWNGPDVGEGWQPLLRQLHDRLRELAPAYRIVQIKEKFGILRFYADGLSQEGQRLVHQAERESSKLCERCGAPGQLRGDGMDEDAL